MTSCTQSTTHLPLMTSAKDPDRCLVIGPDRAGNLLEIVVLIAGTADEIIIHAMPMRPKYRKLLEQ